MCQNGNQRPPSALPPGLKGPKLVKPPSTVITLPPFTGGACTSTPCEQGGHCNNAGTAFRCTCSSGFSGETCQVNVDECASEPCLNGATCTDGRDSFSCTCREGYGGRYCEVDVDECASAPCVNSGRCQDGIAAYACRCSSGYNGENCESPIDVCVAGEDNCDRVHAECISTGPGTHACECDLGWTTSDQGATCTEIDDCESVPCLHGAICRDRFNGFDCDCQAGYSGLDCSIDVDECASDPCLNGAHCTDSTDSQHRRMQAAAAGAYLCRCRHGFEGDECQTNTDECASRPCLHGSHCVDMTDAFTCHCSAGWSGDVCEVEVNECESSPCQNAGRCLDGVDTYSCDCAAGWLGSTCGEEVDACQRGEGTCDAFHAECIHTGPGTFDCECFPGFETADAGHTCTDINECASRPCRNAGRCTDELSSYLCECDLGYVGVNCAENVDDCALLPYGSTCPSLRWHSAPAAIDCVSE